MGSTEGIRELAEPSLASVGLEIWDVEVSHDVVRILVDRPGGIDLDALTAASGVISPLLDEHPDLTPGDRYQLEVSSPGVERTLRTAEQFRRYLGQEVSVKTGHPIDGSRRHQGVLMRADEIGIEVAPADRTPFRLSYNQIERARSVLVWGPQPKPKAGGGGSPKRSAAAPHAAAPGATIPGAPAPDPKDTGS